jgi:thermostable 8-oxoguanine DNA glycosylase
MPNIELSLLDEIRETLKKQGFNFQKWINSFGQVEALEKRQKGKIFSLREHVRGLLLSQLSNNRPWGPIAENIERIGQIFLDYDPDLLKQADPDQLAEQIKNIRCGNRAIVKQMRCLRQNIEMFERIGDIDQFVTSDAPDVVAREFAAGKHKLIQVGFPLAMEYLRNVGINTVKPDLHVCRIIGPERLGLCEETPTPEQAHSVLMDLALQSQHSAMYIDNLLWLFAAKDYAAICTAKPRCDVCLVTRCNRRTFA